jgi:hypothetical protein
MNVELSPEIQSNSILLMLVASANTVFESELGQASDAVSARWSLFTDSDLRPYLRLHMRNHGKCDGDFVIADLHDVNLIRTRFRSWCAELLRAVRNPPPNPAP